MVTSIRMAWLAKITAPIGAPKMADMAPATPKPIRKVLFFALRCIITPKLEPIEIPVITTGASNPTEPPNPTVNADVIARLYIFTLGIKLLFFEMPSSMTGIPCPPLALRT